MSAQKQAPEVIKVSLAGVLADLEEGMGRKEIARKYGLSNNAVKQLFELPQLKGRKAKKPTPFELVIDAEVAPIKTRKKSAAQVDEIKEVHTAEDAEATSGTTNTTSAAPAPAQEAAAPTATTEATGNAPAPAENKQTEGAW